MIPGDRQDIKCSLRGCRHWQFQSNMKIFTRCGNCDVVIGPIPAVSIISSVSFSPSLLILFPFLPLLLWLAHVGRSIVVAALFFLLSLFSWTSLLTLVNTSFQHHFEARQGLEYQILWDHAIPITTCIWNSPAFQKHFFVHCCNRPIVILKLLLFGCSLFDKEAKPNVLMMNN